MSSDDELSEERAAMRELLLSHGAVLPPAGAEDSDSASDSGGESQTIAVGGDAYTVLLAPDDGSLTGTLFASRVWNGALLIAEYVAAHGDLFVGARVAELGAACALPSLAALRHGAAHALVTDYPEAPLLERIAATMAANGFRNCESAGANGVRGCSGCGDFESAGANGVRRCSGCGDFEIMGHQWGKELQSLGGSADWCFAAECLWLHREHANLAESLWAALRPGGRALVSYAHHVPGCEAEDDAFFAVAARRGFAAEGRSAGRFERPFREGSGETQEQFLRVLRKPAAGGGGAV